jgi:hypothetical protein
MEVQYGSLREKIAAESKARKERYAGFEAAYEKARKAGIAAGEAAKPRTMVVTQHANPANDASPAVQQWIEPEGMCGFAWVKVTPGSSSFAKWLVKNKIARKAYGGGVDIWISAFGQSVERKEACARAMAKVLVEELSEMGFQGVNVYADSRLD